MIGSCGVSVMYRRYSKLQWAGPPWLRGKQDSILIVSLLHDGQSYTKWIAYKMYFIKKEVWSWKY